MFNWLTRFFSTSNPNENLNPMNKFLIVGLGNIGTEYINTRHNIGFKIVDYIIEKENLSVQAVKLGSLAEWKHKGKVFYFLKPNTYMNLSGKAVKYWMDKEKIPLENILIIADDLNLPFGAIRIRKKGSDGGHNGLKNISLLLNTTEYPRFRFGISDQFKKGQQIDYVLGVWNATEMEKLKERCTTAAAIILNFGLVGLDNTMTAFNGK